MPSQFIRRFVLCLLTGAMVIGAACGGGEASEVQKGVEDTSTTTPAPDTTSTTAPVTSRTVKATTTTAPKATTTTEAPTPTTAQPASSDLSFANCTEAKAAGYHDIQRGAPGYASKLDRNNDGVACES